MKLNQFMMMTVLATVAILTSCTGESDTIDNNENTGNITFNISTIASSSTNPTRSVTSGTEIGTPEEWIKSYTLYVVDDNTNKVEKIFTRPTENTTLVKSEILKLKEEEQLTLGPKTVYAIGNMTGTEAGINLAVGDVVDAPTMKSMIYDATASSLYDPHAPSGMYGKAGAYIPMSNIIKIDAYGKDQTYTIPLYRMFGKMILKFTNGSGSDITLNNFTVSSVTKDKIYLFPNDHINFKADRTNYKYAPVLPTTTSVSDFSRNPEVTLKNGENRDEGWYILESKADDTTKHLAISVSTSKDGNSVDKYTLTDFSYINRNDVYIIPVTLTNYIFNPVVLYYPPIGGYPIANITNTDGKFYCTFSNNGGDFVITPNIHKDGDDAPASCRNVSVKIMSDTNPSLFATAPIYNSTDGTIKGTLSTNTGTAVLQLMFKVSENMSLVRNLYIVVK